MNWLDLMRMSFGNLKRRKLRTFLTVLGVMIGTTSIVVMISLGLGLEASMYEEMEMYGGITKITVTGAAAGDSMVYYGPEEEGGSDKRLDDSAVQELKKLEGVADVSPQYDMSVHLLKGGYEGWAQLTALTPESLQGMGLELAEGGRLPVTGTSTLELLYGNGIITNFYEKGSGNGYYETGKLPDIDLSKDTVFLILDEEGYYASMGSSEFGAAGSGDDGGSGGGQPVKVRKHPVKASGVVAGSPDEYKPGYYNVYCDLDTLKQVLKKEFKGRAIPGQPTTKTGKPYKEFCYSSVNVKAEDKEKVDSLVAEIRSLGYQANTNAEYLESAKRELALIEALLGGIGAVSLLVAAIGIANTMMMSIYERTKEIGVFKVLGCSLKNIRQMFLMEASGIGLIGGVSGAVLSFLLSAVINFLVRTTGALGLSGNLSYIPPWLVLAAVGFAVLVGTLAGFFPALRAMRLSPLAAIRTE